MIVREILSYSDYAIKREVRSRIDPEKNFTLVAGVLCPHCKKKHKEPPHGGQLACSCGLSALRYGEKFYCTIEEDKL